jgi:hypothetical protein
MTFPMTPIKLMLLALSFSLVACATKTQSQIGDAATTPLSDLNIVKADIPEILEIAKKKPYLMPADPNCSTIAFEVQKLDEVLGPDLDAPVSETDPSLLDRGTEAAENTAVGALRSTAEGLIPFRGWVRKLSGAERYSKRVSSAIAAGSMRRAFLKGVGASQACAWVTPPQPTTASVPPPVQSQSQ